MLVAYKAVYFFRKFSQGKAGKVISACYMALHLGIHISRVCFAGIQN